ncbi:MAG: hypothetical protein LC796_06150 [Acidobacteria bacterium]|nr:hypothetical protein [Acidobacteriota bacterium]MCA1611071.1 hypothetical protein [Acidobacteriota bacterium]
MSWTPRRVILALLVIASPSMALANHSWGGYHWARTSNPFTLKTGDNVDSNWQSYFDAALSDWTSSSVLNLTAVTGTSNKHCSAVAGTIQVCNGRYGNNGWLGLASISITGGTHITQGTVKVNDTYFDTATYNNPNERRHVMCQEIGHTFGLDHQSTDGSSQDTCMDYFSNTGANAGSTLSTRPNAHDYDELVTIYTHLDSSTTVKSAAVMPPAMEDLVLDGPGQWGREIERSEDGSTSTFELDFGHGNKILTFVNWADGGQADVEDRSGPRDPAK